MKRWPRILGLTLALLWIQAIAALEHPVSRVPQEMFAAFSADAVLLLAFVVIGCAAGRPKLFAHVAAWLLVLSSIFRTASAVVLVLYDRTFQLADCELFYALFFIWLKDEPQAVRIAWTIGVIVVPLAVVLVTARAFRAVAVACARPRRAAALLVTGLVLALGGWALAAARPSGETWWRSSSLLQLGREVVRSTRAWIDPDTLLEPIRENIAAGTRRMNEVPHGLEHLAGVDVHFLVIESYGRFAWRHPDVRPTLVAGVERWSNSLEAGGVAMRTGAVAPSVLGGASQRSHAELLGGLKVKDNQTWEMVITSELVPLSKHMRNAGWHTVEMMPQMPFHWVEGYEFYGVEQGLAEPELLYDGFVYHFGRVPDQYGLHRLLQDAIEPAEKPVFSMFVSVSSHAPWSTVPPYIEDWQIDAATFRGEPAIRHPFSYADIPHAPGLTTAYRDAVTYALDCAFGFVQQLQRSSLVFVIGDHQPPIARSAQPADPSKDVPVHVLTNRPELLARIDELGFAAGLQLPEEHRSFAMADLAPALLRLYSK